MFRHRRDAAEKLAATLKGRKLHDPLVLAIPRGGVVIGAVLARELSAELDVVLSRKLRAPKRAELAIGAITEDGGVYLDPYALEYIELPDEYLAGERAHQLAEIARFKELFRSVRLQSLVTNRSVIITDDGIATGSTMMAAIRTVKAESPREIIVAVPVASPDRFEDIRRECDDVVCLLVPDKLSSIGQFYEDFDAVGDEEAVESFRRTVLASSWSQRIETPCNSYCN